MSSPKSIFSFKIESNVHFELWCVLLYVRYKKIPNNTIFNAIVKYCKRIVKCLDIKILHFRWSLQEAEDWRGGWGHVLGPRPLPQPLVLLPHPRQAEAQDHLHTGTTGVTAFFNFQTTAQWRFCNKCPNSQFPCCMYLVLD